MAPWVGGVFYTIMVPGGGPTIVQNRFSNAASIPQQDSSLPSAAATSLARPAKNFSIPR
jgi:hypothetical protein